MVGNDPVKDLNSIAEKLRDDFGPPDVLFLNAHDVENDLWMSTPEAVYFCVSEHIKGVIPPQSKPKSPKIELDNTAVNTPGDLSRAALYENIDMSMNPLPPTKKWNPSVDTHMPAVRSIVAMAFFTVIMTLFTSLAAGAGLVKYLVLEGTKSETKTNKVEIIHRDGLTWSCPGDMSAENFKEFMALNRAMMEKK